MIALDSAFLMKILPSQYRLESGVGLATGLLGSPSKTPSLDILNINNNVKNASETNKKFSDLSAEISNISPKNVALIGNLNAVTTLSKMGNKAEFSTFDSYVNPYDAARFTDPSYQRSGDSLVSLLI